MKGLFDRFGAPVVFFSALAEATVGVGIVFPGVVLLFLGGAFADEQGTPVVLILMLAVVGTIIGDTLSYTLGRWGGSRLAGTRFGPQLRFGQAVLVGRARWLIPFYHLNSWTRAVGPFGAGALHLPLRVWMPLDYLGAVISSTVWVGLGFVFGQALLTEEGKLEEHPALRIGLGLAALVWFLLVRREFIRSYRRAREDAADEDAPASEGAAGSERRGGR